MIDIITITKNDKKGLLKTVESTKALRDNFPITQIIIDSSDNNIKNEISEISNKEKNVLYFWQEPQGISAAFNFGISKSNSEKLWFLNGGDVLNSEIDLNCFYYLIKNSTADAIIFQIQYKQTKEILPLPELWALWPPVSSWIPHPSTIISRKLFDKYGEFNKRYNIAMDYEIWLRFFSKKVKVDVVSIPIVLFDKTGLAFAENKNTKKEVSIILRKYFFIILKKWFWQLRIIAKAFYINSRFFKSKKR